MLDKCRLLRMMLIHSIGYQSLIHRWRAGLERISEGEYPVDGSLVMKQLADGFIEEFLMAFYECDHSTILLVSNCVDNDDK